MGEALTFDDARRLVAEEYLTDLAEGTEVLPDGYEDAEGFLVELSPAPIDSQCVLVSRDGVISTEHYLLVADRVDAMSPISSTGESRPVARPEEDTNGR